MRKPYVLPLVLMLLAAVAMAAVVPVNAQTDSASAEADNSIARAFRDEWLKKFDGKLPPMPAVPPGIGDPEFLEWREFHLSLSLVARQLMVDPNRRVVPSAAGAITRTAIQLFLGALVGDNSLGGIGSASLPRDVYDERIADEQAQLRLNIMAQAVHAYVGATEADEFRVGSPAVRVKLASRAALGMIDDQKKTWPNAMLLSYATTGKMMPETIAKLLGKDTEQFRRFMTEPSLRVRSMLVADGFAAMITQTGEVPLSGAEFDRFATEVMEIKLNRERERPARAVLEALGKAAQESYRKSRGKERDEILHAALLLKAIGTLSWTFATFTPETIDAVFGK